MDTHKNASLTPRGREAMARGVMEGGLSKAAVSRQFNTTPKTVAKWVARFQAEGPAVAGVSGISRGAIIAPMEGEYGDHEGHAGRSFGWPRPEGCVFRRTVVSMS